MKVVRLIERRLYIPTFGKAIETDLIMRGASKRCGDKILNGVYMRVKSSMIVIRFQLRNSICRTDAVADARHLIGL